MFKEMMDIEIIHFEAVKISHYPTGGLTKKVLI